MSKEGLKEFVEAIAYDPDLTQIVLSVARESGYDLSAADLVRLAELVKNEQPRPRPLPDDMPRATTMALGEEGKGPGFPR